MDMGSQRGSALINAMGALGIMILIGMALSRSSDVMRRANHQALFRDTQTSAMLGVKNKASKSLKGIFNAKSEEEVVDILNRDLSISDQLTMKFTNSPQYGSYKNKFEKQYLQKCRKYSKTSAKRWKGSRFEKNRSLLRSIFCADFKKRTSSKGEEGFDKISHAFIVFDVRFIESHSGAYTSMSKFGEPANIASIEWTLIWKESDNRAKTKAFNSQRQGAFVLNH